MPKRFKQLDILLGHIRLPKNTRRVFYLAVPISGGIRLWNLAHEHGFSDLTLVRRRLPVEYQDEVWRPNSIDAERTTAKVSKTFLRKLIVNPAKIEIPGWSQEEYRRTWKAFITQFVGAVIASSGWNYSHGCVEEVVHALKLQIPIYDVNGSELTSDQLQAELDRARSEATRMGLKVQFLDRIPKLHASSSMVPIERQKAILAFK